MSDRPDCTCSICAYGRRRAETDRVLEQARAADFAAVAVAVLLPVLVIVGIAAAWLVGQ